MNNKALEKKMVKYKDILGIEAKDNGESFIAISSRLVPYGYLNGMNDMKSYFGGKIIVRETVYEKLIKAKKKLKAINPNLSFFVTYGYRSLEIQTKKFVQQIQIVSGQRYFSNPLDLYEEVHRYIAVPSVAGHPTGGAVDLVIVNNKDYSIIDFGSSIYDFSNKKCYTFCSSVSNKAKENRLLLRNLMLEQGFAPFDGEWWHFSYGDKEWTYYYKKNKALYNQIQETDIKF